MPLDLRTAARIEMHERKKRDAVENLRPRVVCAPSSVRRTNGARDRDLSRLCLCCSRECDRPARLDGRHPPTVSILPYQIITNQRAFLIYPCSWHCHFFPSVRLSAITCRLSNDENNSLCLPTLPPSSEMEMVARQDALLSKVSEAKSSNWLGHTTHIDILRYVRAVAGRAWHLNAVCGR